MRFNCGESVSVITTYRATSAWAAQPVLPARYLQNAVDPRPAEPTEPHSRADFLLGSNRNRAPSSFEHDEGLCCRGKRTSGRAAEARGTGDSIQVIKRIGIAARARREHEKGKCGLKRRRHAIWIGDKLDGPYLSSWQDTTLYFTQQRHAFVAIEIVKNVW